MVASKVLLFGIGICFYKKVPNSQEILKSFVQLDCKNVQVFFIWRWVKFLVVPTAPVIVLFVFFNKPPLPHSHLDVPAGLIRYFF